MRCMETGFRQPERGGYLGLYRATVYTTTRSVCSPFIPPRQAWILRSSFFMPAPIEPDEVIPPHLPGHGLRPPGGSEPERNATARIIARWLDELLAIPGTKFKIGLDPLLAFVPGVGDFLSSSVSAVVIIESVRKGVAASVIMRMGLNMLANAFLDALPGVGPFLSAFFKSNSRNLMLLQRWQEGEHLAVKRSSRVVVLSVFGMIAGTILLSLAGWFFYLWVLVKLVTG